MGIYQRLGEIEREGGKAVLVVIVGAEGPAPREPGAKMLVLPGGRIEGTIGGGPLEQRAIREATELLRGGGPRLRTYALAELGMSCGGRVTVYYEPISPPAVFHIFGAGHIGALVAEIAQRTLPFETRLYDTRPEAQGPGIRQLSDYGELPEIGERDYVLICTHSHEEDFKVLKGILEGGVMPAYVGMVGSRVKWAEMGEKLRSLGIPGERIGAVRCPVGLPLGGKDPGAIALSVLAEVLAVHNGRLREAGEGLAR